MASTRELFLRLSLGTHCEDEFEYDAEVARCWPALHALLLDHNAPIYNRCAGIARLEVDAIFEPAEKLGGDGTVVLDVLLELRNLNPKAPADVAKPLLQRELKRLCSKAAVVRMKRVVPGDGGWGVLTGGAKGNMTQRLVGEVNTTEQHDGQQMPLN
jgi:hypothetical protein